MEEITLEGYFMKLEWKTCFKIGISIFILYLAIRYGGNIADFISKNSVAITLSQNISITAEQFGLRTSMFFCSLFPLIGFVALLWYTHNKNK